MGVDGTFPTAVSGNTVVGYYGEPLDVTHSFIVTVPEPSALALFGVGAIVLAASLISPLRAFGKEKKTTINDCFSAAGDAGTGRAAGPTEAMSASHGRVAVVRNIVLCEN